jgi:PIN domain nuclease of toxin-antitoxin system
MIYLDTHVVVWLYAGVPDLIPPPVRDLLNLESLAISPMVVLELEYLYETNRTSEPATTVIQYLQANIGLTVSEAGFPAVVTAALHQSWTRDPFDRLIVAQAALHNGVLVTKDRLIHAHYPHAFWG